MNQKNFIIPLLIFILILLAWTPSVVQAGFGIAPPTVDNPNLLPGFHYEKQILLLRGEANEDIRATAIIKAPDFPEILDWISIDQGTSFILPKGIKQFPIIINIDVPENAKHKEYRGYIDVRTEANENEKLAGVSILLGARIQLVLGVTDEPIPDFIVRTVAMLNSEECCSVKFSMNIENTGNIKTRPTRIQLRVYHGYKKENLLHLTVLNAQDLDWIDTNETKEIIASFPLILSPGRYWAETAIFKGNQVERSDKMFFTITPGRKILGLTFCTCNIGWVIFKFIVLLVILYLIFRWWREYRPSINIGFTFKKGKRR
ncbi:hypothetical protein IID20_01950 [Patescibacteria group bacterium]|nr:hypothetical protein [Patescibacteria group bacterium]